MRTFKKLQLYILLIVTGLCFAVDARATAFILGKCYYDLNTATVVTNNDLTISWDNPTLSGHIHDYSTDSSTSFSGYGVDHDLSYTLPGSSAHVWANVDQIGMSFDADSTGGNTLSGGWYNVIYNRGFTVTSGSGTLTFSIHAYKLFDLSTDYVGEKAENGDFATFATLALLQDDDLRGVAGSRFGPGAVGVKDGEDFYYTRDDYMTFSYDLTVGDVGSLGLFLDNDHVSAVGETPAAPVPEPATLLLVGSGLIGLAGFRSKFRK